MNFQRGGFALGLVAGLLVGLALALGVALYITKAPIPFVNKVPQRTAEQDSAEAERNRTWDPNAALAGKPAARPASAGSVSQAASAAMAGASAPAAAAPSPAPAQPSPRDPAAILSGGSGKAASAPAAAPATPATPTLPTGDAFVYFVQAGAFTRSDDAEQQRARLALLGLTAKITEREQAGRTMYRVRVGPFPIRDEADRLQARLQEQTIESQIVRVEKP
ncbi:MAG: SPOR domain-containing protein [Rubrivivax sp.]|nr:SPOR domain-containing protein [Rubrivivax sp.]